MPVEKLTVIEGPMAGLEDNPGIIEDTANWMRSNGISPGLVALGGLAGAAFGSGSMLGCAIRWSIFFGLASWVHSRCSR